ncbi:MAG TPA: Gfo/Idh/MocA family oxidoreductase [Tepidisphaeraceae bacterium]|jgi:predicted dehydrogenase|nr:Gfo/Idh/MocA family oxidoreductase [Tepidisphaeraceae bacterium]
MAKKAYNDMSTAGNKPIPAPAIRYQPPLPRRYSPPVALIGCGGVSTYHLAAYRAMKLNVVALCDRHPERADARRKEFFPKAKVYDEPRQLLGRDDIEVVDITTHPKERAPLITAAIDAGKHVLSQKPFVLDLDVGERLAERAERKGVKLAVNHNGRWAPHLSYVRNVIAAGLIGEVFAAHLACHWNHEWIESTPFNAVHHIVLYDYAIHWFDILTCMMPDQTPRTVFATLARAPHQKAKPPLLAQAILEFDNAQASLLFDAAIVAGPRDTGYIAGTRGSARYEGTSLTQHAVTVNTEKGHFAPKLAGKWWREGFMGTMGELLCAIEEKREPFNSAQSSLAGLAACFAAVRSADSGRPQQVGKVRKMR